MAQVTDKEGKLVDITKMTSLQLATFMAMTTNSIADSLVAIANELASANALTRTLVANQAKLNTDAQAERKRVADAAERAANSGDWAR